MNKNWIWLNLLDMENNKKLEIIKKHENIDELFELYKNCWDEKYIELTENIYEYNKKNNIQMVDILSKDYPDNLRNIYNPPILLYYIGNIELLKENVLGIYTGIEIDGYGRKLLKNIANLATKKEMVICCRMQKSEENLNNSKKIYVLSCGISNKFNTKDNLIISEYEYFVKTSKERNILRNRIITGISKNLVIIEAGLKDGVQYFVDFALDQGRELWVIPSDVTRENSFYTNELIKYGVNILTSFTEL